MTRYELTERIGVGAMAEIFRGKAIAAGGFEKPVAIKRILPHLSEDKRFVELLIAEANIVSLLRHRNIVQVFDVGQGPDGHFFVVLEFVDGTDLAALQTGLEADGKRLPADLGLYIAAEICDALEHAYRAPGPDGQPLRLVHRDVAPTNVLLSRSGEVKLTDFGIAKRAEEATSHGGVRGKFAYISPEQAWSRPVDARSDVYSVGILLFELVLGKRLFSRMAGFDALHAVRDGKVPRPRGVDPGLDPRLEAILLKALAHDPAQRFGGAGALGKELRAFRYSLPSSGGDPAAELAAAIDYFGPKGRARRALAAQRDDDFLSSTGSFTLTGRESLVREQSYAKARQVIEEEETRMGILPVQPEDSGTLEAMLGAQPLGPDLEGEDGSDVTNEVTRVVMDPFLVAPPPRPRAAARSQAPQGPVRTGPHAQMPAVPAPPARPPAPPPLPAGPPRGSSVPLPAVSPAAVPLPAVPLPSGSPPGLRLPDEEPAAPRQGLDAPLPAPPETIRGAKPLLGFESPAPAPFSGEDARARAGGAVAPPSAGQRPAHIMNTAAVPVVRPRSRFLRVTLVTLLLGGLAAAGAMYKDMLLDLAGELLPLGMAPDAAVPDAAVPDAAPPDAALPDAAVPDAAPVDAMAPGDAPDAGSGAASGDAVDAAAPDEATAGDAEDGTSRKPRRRRKPR